MNCRQSKQGESPKETCEHIRLVLKMSLTLEQKLRLVSSANKNVDWTISCTSNKAFRPHIFAHPALASVLIYKSWTFFQRFFQFDSKFSWSAR